MRGFALAASLALSACGAPRYLPVELLSPSSGLDLVAREDPILVTARLGFDWVEVEVTNQGSSPAWVEANGLSFTTATAGEHRLVDSRVLDDSRAAWAMASWTGGDRATYASALAEASRQQFLVWEAGAGRVPDRVEIEPGRSAQLILYPVDHLRVGAGGFTSLLPLFCDVSDPAHLEDTRFRITLPLSSGDGWHTVEIAGRWVAREPEGL